MYWDDGTHALNENANVNLRSRKNAWEVNFTHKHHHMHVFSL